MTAKAIPLLPASLHWEAARGLWEPRLTLPLSLGPPGPCLDLEHRVQAQLSTFLEGTNSTEVLDFMGGRSI